MNRGFAPTPACPPFSAGIITWASGCTPIKSALARTPSTGSIFRKTKKIVKDLLGQYQVEYLVFGKLELEDPRGNRPPYGPESLKRIEEWDDLFHLVFRIEEQSIFEIDRSLNRVYGAVRPDEPKTHRPPCSPRNKAYPCTRAGKA